MLKEVILLKKSIRCFLNRFLYKVSVEKFLKTLIQLTNKLFFVYFLYCYVPL